MIYFLILNLLFFLLKKEALPKRKNNQEDGLQSLQQKEKLCSAKREIQPDALAFRDRSPPSLKKGENNEKRFFPLLGIPILSVETAKPEPHVKAFYIRNKQKRSS